MIFMPPLPSVVPTLLLLPFLFPTTLCPLTLFCNDPVRFSRVAYRGWVKGGLQETVYLISGSTTEVNVSPLTLPTINRVQTPRLGWSLVSYFCLLVKKLNTGADKEELAKVTMHLSLAFSPRLRSGLVRRLLLCGANHSRRNYSSWTDCRLACLESGLIWGNPSSNFSPRL